MMKAVAFTLGQ